VLFLAAAAAVYLLFALVHITVAHAADAPPLPPVPGVDWTIVLLGVIAGLSAVRTFLAFLAPRTSTTVDDKALAVINAALSVLSTRTPGPIDPGTTIATTTVTTRDPQAGKVNVGALATLALGSILVGTLVGFAAVGISSGCATVRPVAGQVVTAELDCSSAAIVDVAKSLGNAAQAYLAGKVAGDGRTVDTAAIKTDLRALGSKAWSCAVAVALNVVLGQPTARTSIAHAAGPAPDWRSVLIEVKSELGVSAVRLPTGEVL